MKNFDCSTHLRRLVLSKPALTYRQHLERKSTWEETDADKTYISVYDTLDAFPDQVGHFLHRFLVRVVDAQVETDRAETTLHLRRLEPVLADLRRIDAEVGPLQRADARHRVVVGRHHLLPAIGKHDLLALCQRVGLFQLV